MNTAYSVYPYTIEKLAVEKDIMQTNFDQCKSAAEYWKKNMKRFARREAMKHGRVAEE